jgi:hypothetical protein
MITLPRRAWKALSTGMTKTCGRMEMAGVLTSLHRQSAPQDLEDAPPLYSYPDSLLDFHSWPMDLPGPHDDQERMEPATVQFSSQMQDVASGHHGVASIQRPLDLVQTVMPMDSAVSAHPSAQSPQARSRESMPPPQVGDRDVSRGFAPRRLELDRPEDASRVPPLPLSPTTTDQIGPAGPNLLPDANHGASHSPQHELRSNAKRRAAAAPANGSSLASSSATTAQPQKSHGNGHSDETGRSRRASACESVATDETGDRVLMGLSAVQGLGEEEIFKLLAQVPRQMLGKYMKSTTSPKKAAGGATHSAGESAAGRNVASTTRPMHGCPDANCDRKFSRKCELK